LLDTYSFFAIFSWHPKASLPVLLTLWSADSYIFGKSKKGFVSFLRCEKRVQSKKIYTFGAGHTISAFQEGRGVFGLFWVNTKTKDQAVSLFWGVCCGCVLWLCLDVFSVAGGFVLKKFVKKAFFSWGLGTHTVGLTGLSWVPLFKEEIIVSSPVECVGLFGTLEIYLKQ